MIRSTNPSSYAPMNDAAYLRKKFYQRIIDFKEYRELSEERKQELTERANFESERFEADYAAENKYAHSYGPRKEWYKYVRMFGIVSAHGYQSTFKSFDERAYFLVKALDPEYEIMKCYNSQSIIRGKHTKEEREALIEARKQEISSFIQAKLGTIDSSIIKLERALYALEYEQEELEIQPMKRAKDNK